MALNRHQQDQQKSCPVATAIAVLVVGVALAVLGGWLVESSALVQVKPGLAPMQATTAFGFLLFSGGLFLLAASPRWNRWHLERYLAVALLVWGILNLLQHVTGLNLGIDYVLGEPFTDDNSPAPGRMSLLTSLSFILAGAAMSLSVISSREAKLEVSIVFLASILSGLSGAALFCRFLEIPRVIWLGARFSEMALHTSACFWVLSTALIMQRFRCGRALYQEAFRWMWAPVLCATIFAVGTIYLGFHAQSENNRIRLAHVRADFLAGLLNAHDVQLELALARMANRVADMDAAQRNQWESDVHKYLDDFGSLDYLRVTDPASDTEWNSSPELATIYDPWLNDNRPAGLPENGHTVIAANAAFPNKMCYWFTRRSRANPDASPITLAAIVDLDAFIKNAYHFLEDDIKEMADYQISMHSLEGDPDLHDHRSGEADALLSPDLYLEVKVEQKYVAANRQLETVLLVGGVALAVILALLTYMIYFSRQRYVELEETQHLLQRQKYRLEAYVKHAPAAVAMFDRRVRYIALSERWRTDYALEGRNVIGVSHYDVFPNISDEWKEIHQQCLKGEVIFNERDCWRPEGWDHDQYLRWEVRPWYESDESVGGIMMLTEDITTAVMREQELIETREKAESANRAKTNFLANMSHEIRTPMNAILGFTELLGKEIDDPRQKEFLNSIQSSGKTLLSLINDLLDLAKIEAGKVELAPKPVNLRQMLTELVAVFQLQADTKGVQLRYEISGQLPEYMMLDDFRLRQVLLNLLSNAIKFTDSGSVTLALEGIKREQMYDLKFAVQDTGSGIPESFRERAFSKFEQVDSGSHGGTGLGLAISAKLVALMGGKLDYESTLGQGATFFFTLPKIYQAAPSVDLQEYDDDQQRLVFPECTILLVDDAPENLNLMRAVFQDETSIKIIEAGGGVAGMEMAEAHQPDLILLDIAMPDMDGREVCQRLRKKPAFVNTPILAITASLQKSANELLEYGFSECLFKPLPPHTLLCICHRWLKGRTRPRTPTPFEKSQLNEIAPDSPLPEPLIKELKSKLGEHQNGLVLSDLETMAASIESIAAEHEAHELAGIAAKLKQSAQSFDIAGARQALGLLNQYLNQSQTAET